MSQSIYTKGTLNNIITNKIKNMTFNAIVTETFISALPIEDINSIKKESLVKSSFNVLESLGGCAILENALKSEKDIFKKALLENINEICTEAANKTAKRVMKNYDKKDDDDKESPDEVIRKTKMSNDERNSFYNKVKNSDINEISAEINNKVVEVIKDEKNSYKAELELKNKINEELEEEDKTVESLLPFITNKNDAKSHISLFSSIQSSCIESLTYKTDNYKTFQPDLIEDISLEFYGKRKESKSIDDMDNALESLLNYVKTPQLNSYCNKNTIMDVSFINAITIYTLLETLNTLNLITPSCNNVKDYILKDKSISNINADKTNSISQYAENCIKNIDKNISGSNSIIALERCKDKLNAIKESLTKGENILNIKLLNSVEDSIEKSNIKINDIKNSRIEGEVQESDKSFLRDIAEMNKISNIIGRKPMVSKIMFEPVSESSIDAIGLDCEGKTVAKSFIDLSTKYSLLNKSLESYLADVIKKSKMDNSNMDIFLKKDNKKINLR